jgi:hypothetical protein
VEARFYETVQIGPGAHPPSYIIGTGPLSGGQSGGGVALTTHPIPLLPLWVFEACSTVNFTFTFTVHSVQWKCQVKVKYSLYTSSRHTGRYLGIQEDIFNKLDF